MSDNTKVLLADGTVGEIALYEQGVQEAIVAGAEITVQLHDENGVQVEITGTPVDIL